MRSYIVVDKGIKGGLKFEMESVSDEVGYDNMCINWYLCVIIN